MKDCNLSEEILDEIHSDKSVVSLVKQGVDDGQIEKILKEMNKKTTVLNLDSNEITNVGAKILSQNLHFFPKLKKLCLQFNQIDKEGMLDLMQEKQNHPELEILLYGNKVFLADEMLQIEQEAANRFLRPSTNRI